LWFFYGWVFPSGALGGFINKGGLDECEDFGDGG